MQNETTTVKCSWEWQRCVCAINGCYSNVAPRVKPSAIKCSNSIWESTKRVSEWMSQAERWLILVLTWGMPQTKTKTPNSRRNILSIHSRHKCEKNELSAFKIGYKQKNNCLAGFACHIALRDSRNFWICVHNLETIEIHYPLTYTKLKQPEVIKKLWP